MIIKDTTVLNFFDLSIKEHVDVVIEGNKIVEVSEAKIHFNEDVIDGSSYFLIPGFVNAHAHTAMAFLRGSAEDTTSLDWFNKHIWIYEKNIKEGDVYLGTILGAVEMISSGITTVFDHYFNMEESFKAYSELGMRADLAYTIFGNGENKEKNFKDALSFLDKFFNKNDLITLSLGPHSPYICEESYLKEVASISKKNNLKVHIHISEEPWQVEKSLKEHGKTPVEYIDSLGLLSENTILAHAYYSTDSDIKIIKERNANVSHAAKTYMRFAWINDFIVKAINEDLNITFATDGAASNSNYSIVEVGRLAAFIGKIATKDPTKAKVEEIVKLFGNGEEFLKKPISKIKEGYLADIVFLDKNSVRLNPPINLFANILYSLSEQDIKKVMINGKFVFEDGKILGIEKEKLIREIKSTSKRLVENKSDSPMQTFG